MEYSDDSSWRQSKSSKIAKSDVSTRLSAIDVKITPLYGCFEDTGRGSGPVCSLLEVGDVTILLDCGWDINFDESLLSPLADVVSKVDLVLISHADLEHLGGLPYAVGILGLKAPIFATLPTLKMGQMVVYDAHQVRTLETGGNFKTFSLDDADAAFDQIKSLKYSQHLRFSEEGRGAGVTITPYAAGHIIGSSIWRICWQTDDNDVVYAVSFNHRREEHLNGGSIESFSRPSIMITDAHNALTIQIKPPRKRASELIDLIMTTVRNGGNVLMPCDAAGRVLELLLLLDHYWTKNKLNSYPLVLLHSMAFNTGEFAKSQLEWMSDSISRQFDLQRSNPFDMRHVTMAHSLEELQALGSGPKVVLATDLSLDYGFAKGLLLAWAADPVNLVLMTQRGHGNTLARELLSGAHAQAKVSGGEVVHFQRVVVEVPERVPLVGEELSLHLEEEARRRRQAAEEEEHKRQAEQMELGQVLVDSDEEDADSGTILPVKRKRAPNATLFSKFSKPQHLMFGFHDIVVRVDDYGVREAEPIGWLAVSMQERNDTSGLIQEEDEQRQFEQQVADDLLLAENNVKGHAIKANAASAHMTTHTTLRSDSAFYQDTGMLPSKVLLRVKELEIRAKVAFVDMEGLSDGRSVRNLLSTVGPKQLVLIGGGQQAVASLSDDARDRQICARVFSPRSGNTVQVHLGTDVQDVVLHDSLSSQLRWQTLKGYELAQVDCVLQEVHGSTDIIQNKKTLAPTLIAHQDRMIGETGCPAVFVSFGEVQLTQLSSAFKKAGMATSFAAAKLTVNDSIEVTKDKDGQIKIEGPLSEDYFAVRNVVYKQFTIVA